MAFNIVRALTERIRAWLVTGAALDLEADLVTRDAERCAELLRQAKGYDAEGLHSVAQQLRQQAEALSHQRPLASIMPALHHLQESPIETLPQVAPAPAHNLALPMSRKKGKTT